MTSIERTHPNSRAWSAGTVLVAPMTVVLLCALAARAAEPDWAKKRAALGRGDKFRVLVDKVLSPSNKWVMTGKFVDEIRDAGFNVVVPRVGGDDMKRVERVANMARDRGLFYMAWMRGTLSTKTGTKLVWANGAEQDLYSPNADELWDWMTRLILGHARLSAKNPAIVGAFLDFENYAKGSQGNCYALAYDQKILNEFAKAKKLAVPELDPAERHRWLEQNGRFEAFKAFQIESWRRRCRELRQRIDAVNPRFQLIVYPRGTLFLSEAIHAEWGTAKAPLIFADHITYHRPGRLPHAEALSLNKRNLTQGIAFAERKCKFLQYTSGIDPIYDDADPEFCGKNAVMISQTCDGYWIFYEGPDYHGDHVDYFKWFTRANRAIAAGRFDLWREPRETPDPIVAEHERLLSKYCGANVKPFTTDPMPQGAEKTAFTVRTAAAEAVFGVLLKTGEKLQGRLQVRALGRYQAGARFKLYGPDRRQVAEGRAELGKPAGLVHAAKQAGLHVITVNAKPNPARLTVTNQYFCLIAADKVGLLGAQPTAYFVPKRGAREISLVLRSPSPGETAMMTVLDPTGREVAKGDTIAGKEFKAKLSVPAESPAGTWSLKLGRAAKGSVEDLSLELGKGCSEFLATHPSRLLVWAE